MAKISRAFVETAAVRRFGMRSHSTASPRRTASRTTGAALLGALLAATAWHGAPVAADEPAALEVVHLEDRVPARWIGHRADSMPIGSPRWRRILPRRCQTRGGYRKHCSGAREVPEPHGPAARRADRLQLGRRATAMLLRHDRAFEQWLAAARGIDDQRRLEWPVPGGVLGRGFGRVRRTELKHRPHLGLDIGAEEGTPIIAARGGLVVYSDNGLTGYGNAVMILHEDDTTTFYAHCKKTLVFAGELVERGEPIAEVGATGFAAAPHLHFEWRTGGWPRDPLRQMRDARYRRRARHRAGR